jgi:hypothetical protein
MAEMVVASIMVLPIPQVWAVAVLVDIVEVSVVTLATAAAAAAERLVEVVAEEPVMVDLVEVVDQAQCVLFGLAQQDNSQAPA